VIAQRMDLMMAFCGGTSSERFADDFDAAMNDPNVSAIVIDCDSPGGNVTGTPELAKRIFNARGKGKQLLAVSNGQMCSAAYWIASACDEIVASPSSETGSIGVFCVHMDESALNESLGLKYTIIKFGEHKAEGNPWEPLSADAESFIQGQVDEMGQMFVTAVSKHRGVSVATVKSDFGQGRSFTAKQALAAGMVDRIATLEETLNKLGAKDVGMSGRPRRALGAAVATTNDLRQHVEPVVLAAPGDKVADDTAPETEPQPDDDDDEMCPECGGAMDDDGNCTACDYHMAEPKGDADASARASPGSTEQQSSNAPPVLTLHKDHTMDQTELLKAERQRSSRIRQLGKTHNVDDVKVEAMIEEGLTEDQAATRILGDVKARGTSTPTIVVGADRAADRKFESLGDQLHAIVQLGKHGRKDARLARVNHHAMRVDHDGALDMMAGTPSGMNESVGSEGGFFIAPEVLPGVIEPIYKEDPILSRVTPIPIGSSTNRTVYNVVDESARTDGNRWGGIQMFWGDEADTATAKKPKLRQVEQLLKKLIGIGYLTDEMIEDAPASAALLQTAFTTEYRFMVGNGVFRGKGGGQMLGFLNGKGGVVQAIEAGQTIANTAASISQNLAKMKANIPAALWGDLIWLYNQELYPYLINATLGSTTVPAFTPAGGVGDMGSVDRILGGPAYASELCEQVGTPGDIVAIAPSQYHLAQKGGAQIATSLHVRFLNDEMVLRITARLDGKPVWNTTVTPFKGTTARGFFATLNTRS